MIPIYQQQQQQQQPTSFPNGLQFGFGYQKQQQQPIGFRQSSFGPNNMPINSQQDNWSGGLLNGQQMPIQPPPFYYPFDISTWAEGPSNCDGRNQVQPPLKHGNQGRLETHRTPQHGILKHTGQ